MRWLGVLLVGLLISGTVFALPSWFVKKLKVVEYDVTKPSVTVKTPGGKLLTFYGKKARKILEMKGLILKHRKKNKKKNVPRQLEKNTTEVNNVDIGKEENLLERNQAELDPTNKENKEHRLEKRLSRLEERVAKLERLVNKILEFIDRIQKAFVWFTGVR